MPCVVTDGVPMRTPLVTNGLRGSSGIVFLFTCDAGLIERRLGDLAGQLGIERGEVDHHQVDVGTTRDEAEALLHQGIGERRGVAHDLVGVVGERRVSRLAERDRLAGDGVFERAALPPGEHGLVDRLGVFVRAQDARRRAARGASCAS